MRAPYDLIAGEYYDPRHITSRNFDAAIEAYMQDWHCPFPTSGLVLEVGSGRGTVTRYCRLPASRIIQTDVSMAMLSLQPRENARIRIRCDARGLPFHAGVFAGVAAFLFDPYNESSTYEEIARVLAPRGIFVGTLPSHRWGALLRQLRGYSQGRARFRTRNGEFVEVPSLLSSDGELTCRLRAAGLEPEVLVDLRLPPDVAQVSPDIRDPACEAGVTPHQLPIVKLIAARRV
jgi:SAM-dependent methyltransferase